MSICQKSTVLVFEQEPITRAGLVHHIQTHERLCVCATAAAQAEARTLCAEWRPALVVMDCLAPGGLGLMKELPRWSPGVQVVCFTQAEDTLSVQRVLRAGARGYVTRCDSAEALLQTLLGVLAGERQVGPRVSEALLKTLACGGVEVRNSEAAALSNRELEVYRLVGQGLGTRSVAEQLHLSVKTVETHRERIKEKLHLSNGADLQRRAILFHGANGADRL